MYTDPYKDVYPVIVDVLQDLILPEDTYHAKHARRIARTLHVLLDQKPQGRLLELGTGGVIPLALRKLLPELEVHVTHFDTSAERMHSYLAHVGNHFGQFQAYAIDLEYDQIPEEDGFFDWVICCEVLEHMEIDPMFMLSEVNRVLKDEGGLLLTTPNIVSTRGLTKMMMGIEPYFYMQYNKDRSYHRHNYEYSAKSLSVLLKAAGFNGQVWAEDTFEDPTPAVADRLKAAGFSVFNTGDNLLSVSHKAGPVVERYPEFLYAVDD